MKELAVHSILFQPKNYDHLIVGNRSSTIYIVNTKGQVIRTLSSGKGEGGDFVSCITSPKGDWLYGITEDSTLLCYNMSTYKVEHMMKVFISFSIDIYRYNYENIRRILCYAMLRI